MNILRTAEGVSRCEFDFHQKLLCFLEQEIIPSLLSADWFQELVERVLHKRFSQPSLSKIEPFPCLSEERRWKVNIQQSPRRL